MCPRSQQYPSSRSGGGGTPRIHGASAAAGSRDSTRSRSPTTTASSPSSSRRRQSRRIGQPRADLEHFLPEGILPVGRSAPLPDAVPRRTSRPAATFQSSGSSSSLVRRRTRPTAVTRGSSPAVTDGPSPDRRIVRNFTRRKGLPPRPTRVWRKRTGRPEVTAIAAAARTITGAVTRSPATASGASTIRGSPARIRPSPSEDAEPLRRPRSPPARQPSDVRGRDPAPFRRRARSRRRSFPG